MASIKETYKSGLLAAKRLPKAGIVAAITDTYLESIKQRDGDEKTKLIVELDDGEYRIALNNTQAKALAKQWGDESTDWHGKRIKVAKGRTKFGTDDVDCLVLTPQGK